MASVRRLKKSDPKSPWVCEYTDGDGKRRRYTPKTGLFKDADAARKRIEAEIERGEHTPVADTVTFTVAIREWLKECQRRWRVGDGMAGSTLNTYRNNAEIHVIPALGGMLLTKLKRSDLQDFINTKMLTLGPRTLPGLRVVITQTLRFAIYKGWLRADPLAAQPLKLPHKNKTRRPIPNKEDIRAILDALLVRERGEHVLAFNNRIAVVVLSLFSGLRSGEVCGLQWENVDLEEGCLNIRHSQSKFDGLKDPKSTAGMRRIDLAPPVLAMLARLKASAGANASGYVLHARGGLPLQAAQMWNLWHPVLKKAGLLTPEGRNKFTFHALRHAAASLWIEQGLPAFHIKNMIGHSSIRMTLDVYGHMFPDDEKGRHAVHAVVGQFGALEHLPTIHVEGGKAPRRILRATRSRRSLPSR